jgi:hypothetical protein
MRLTPVAKMEQLPALSTARNFHLADLVSLLDHTAKTQYQKFKTNIPIKGTARQQSQFLHSCFCVRFIYSHNRSAYSAAGKLVD